MFVGECWHQPLTSRSCSLVDRAIVYTINRVFLWSLVRPSTIDHRDHWWPTAMIVSDWLPLDRPQSMAGCLWSSTIVVSQLTMLIGLWWLFLSLLSPSSIFLFFSLFPWISHFFFLLHLAKNKNKWNATLIMLAIDCLMFFFAPPDVGYWQLIFFPFFFFSLSSSFSHTKKKLID